MRPRTFQNGLIQWIAGRLLLATTALVFMLSATTWAVDVTTETREVIGIGTTLQEAITEGLLEAIGQVSGRMLETEMATRSIEVSASHGSTEDYYGSEEFQKRIISATKGAVKQYRVLEQGTNERGLYEVKLSVTCLKVLPDVDGRKRLVCATFPCTGAMQSELFEPGGALPSNVFMDSLESAFVQTRRFAVLDRRKSDALAQEMNIVLSGNVPIEDVLRISIDNPTDLVIVGGIDAVEYKETLWTMPSGKEVVIGEGGVEINFRVIDVSSKRIKYADRVRYSYDHQTLQELSGSLTVHRPGNLMLEDAARRICKQVQEAIYPPRVMMVRGNSVTLNEGGQGIVVNQIYDVFAVGEDVFDPYTKEKLGRAETLVGKIQIVSSTAKMATGTIVKKSGDIAVGSICRLAIEQNLESQPDDSEPLNKLRTDDYF